MEMVRVVAVRSWALEAAAFVAAAEGFGPWVRPSAGRQGPSCLVGARHANHSGPSGRCAWLAFAPASWVVR